MVILDYRWRSSFQSFVIRIQQPCVLVVLDFLVPVVEMTSYFVSLFSSRENFIQLSPGRQLIVDGCDIDDFTYDGCGGTISLCDEYDKKGQLYSGTIIILGRGKKLRFKNVKIERCVYLNAGSSYSISAEDGVEVSVLESSVNDNEDDHVQNEEYKRINALQPGADTPLAQMLNFTFEAQVVSPEFTFYDSSKLSSDDSLHIEKLLRAKMDFSFMYASKEKDIWARSVVKDLTIEAGSGLLVLEPVDVSWKYTSVSEKTNIVLASTDSLRCFQISQATKVTKELIPFRTCFGRFLVAWLHHLRKRGELPGYNLTFWRPQAASNYVILGDCVSSRQLRTMSADSSVRSNQPADQLTHRKGTSGWDAVINLSRPSSFCMSTPHFERIWWDKGGDTKRPFSMWRPLPRFGFSSVGDCITEGFEPPTVMVRRYGIVYQRRRNRDKSVLASAAAVESLKSPPSLGTHAQPSRYPATRDRAFRLFCTSLSSHRGRVPPPGYASLGCVATKTDEMPSNDSICCPKLGLVNHANILEDPISRSSSSKGSNCWSIWKVSNQGCTFLATSDTKKTPAQLAYRIADHAKPKVWENITAELKLGCLSVSILDSSCGMDTVDSAKNADDLSCSALDEDDFQRIGLPIMDDGNDHSYFCALRLLVGSDVSDQYKVFPQSARTRCVKPVKTCESQTHHAKWNEHFIFEVPEQASAHLEIEVTDLASKAGKGEVLGSLSVPIGRGATTLKRAASMRIIQQAADVKRVLTCPLTRKTNFQSWKDSLSNAKSGFWIGLSPDGPWECFTAALPLSTIPISLNNSHFALEVTMRNGKKHASLRALVIIANGVDIKLEVSVCPVTMHSSSVSNAGSTSSTSIIDEVFENQWYRPTSGWGSNPASDQGCDVGPWSTKDGSYSSKVFFEPCLPPGWKWTSPWKIEISSSVDSDGWAYAANFQNLNWPSSWKSPKSPHDFVRRRRWVRSWQPMQEQRAEIPRKIIAVMEPHSSTALPWTTMIKDMDLCLQVLSLGSESLPKQQQSSLSRQSTLKQSFMPSKNSVRLADLEKKDMLSYCCPPVGIKQNLWLSVGIDASIVHTDLNMHVYDWKFVSTQFLDSKISFHMKPSMLSGRSPRKDTVLILDLMSLEHVTSFWMVQNRSQRRFRVSVEHDLGASDAAPKTLRLFVPYWIKNISSIPLSYRIFEVEPTEISDADSLSRPDSLSRAAKSSKFSLRYSSKSLIRRGPVAQRNIHILEVIEDCSTDCVMLSPQDYMDCSAGVRFESRDNNSNPAQSCDSNPEHVDVKEFTSDGSYYWFSAQPKMTSDRTKI
uniref:C2 domain-containing protein n=1 Tax=Oryza punctata TaxID=4537 RepID=A0A0E0JZW8_ORYPU